jgi:hypothetical protein
MMASLIRKGKDLTKITSEKQLKKNELVLLAIKKKIIFPFLKN